MLDDSFPHGSIDGFHRGCTGSMCPAAVPCRDVHRRYHGDFRFRQLLDSGLTPAEAVARENEEAAEAARARAVEFRARRMGKAEPAPVEPTPSESEPEPEPEPVEVAVPAPAPKWSIRRVWMAYAPDGKVYGPFESQPAALEFVESLLPRPKSKPEPKYRGRMTEDEWATIRRLHAEGLSDNKIAHAIGRGQASVSSWMRGAGLPSNGVKGAKGVRSR